MKFIEKTLATIASAAAFVATAGVILMMVHICADVAWRSVTGGRLPATVEIVSKYYMVMIAFLPLGWTELRREMIKVDVLDPLLTGRLDVISTALINLLSCGVYAGLTYTTWAIALREMSNGSFIMALNTPVAVWPGYFMLPFGFAIAAMATAVRLALDLRSHGMADER
jgi:TRAP-type C4-dicarboxylate transport system permease small subunit